MLIKLRVIIQEKLHKRAAYLTIYEGTQIWAVPDKGKKAKPTKDRKSK